MLVSLSTDCPLSLPYINYTDYIVVYHASDIVLEGAFIKRKK